MLLSWGLLLPLGVLSARFLRHRKDALWFKLHRVLQVCGLVLALAGFAVALASFSVFSGGASAGSLAHGCLGAFVMTLGLLQPVNAWFRPHADAEKTAARKRWEILHKGSGYTAVTLALLNVLIGASIAGGVWVLVVACFFCMVITAGIGMWRDKRRFEKGVQGVQGEGAQLTAP
jgi:O-antigen/teichoic acid export membrane protein